MEDGGGLGGDILHGGTIAEILVCVCGVDVSSRITKYILSLRSEWSCVTDVLVAKATSERRGLEPRLPQLYVPDTCRC